MSWHCCSLLLIASVAMAQIPAPQFSREGIAQFQSGRPRMLAPGMILELYGEHLGPTPPCEAPIPQNGPYPTEACGVRVTVGGRPAGLQASRLSRLIAVAMTCASSRRNPRQASHYAISRVGPALDFENREIRAIVESG